MTDNPKEPSEWARYTDHLNERARADRDEVVANGGNLLDQVLAGRVVLTLTGPPHPFIFWTRASVRLHFLDATCAAFVCGYGFLIPGVLPVPLGKSSPPKGP